MTKQSSLFDGGRPDRRTVLAAGAAAGLLSACGMQKGRAFLCADAHPEEYPTVQAVKEMGRLLDERTGGRLGIKIYAGGQLGSERDTLEITAFGGLDMNRVNLAPLNAIEPMTARRVTNSSHRSTGTGWSGFASTIPANAASITPNVRSARLPT